MGTIRLDAEAGVGVGVAIGVGEHSWARVRAGNPVWVSMGKRTGVSLNQPSYQGEALYRVY